MQKIIITGAHGLLGSAATKILSTNYEIISTDRIAVEGGLALDITDLNAVENFLSNHNAFALINCAAYTNVDAAEDQEGFALANRINGDGTKNLAAACKKFNCHLVHISTEYIFGTNTTVGITEDSEDFAPLNNYGKSKLAGELAIKETFESISGTSDFKIQEPRAYIVRTSWLFGTGSQNFITKIIELAQKLDKLKVVEDEVSVPVFIDDLCQFVADLLQDLPTSGVYHGVGEGHASRYEFAQEILKNLNISTPIEPVPLSTFPRAAQIGNSLFMRNTKRPAMRNWQEMVQTYINSLNDEQ